MNFGWETALILQSCVTALASGFNALRFLAYPANSGRRRRHRRWGAYTLLVVSLAFLVQSLYLGLLPWMTDLDADILSDPSLRFTVGALPMIASVLVLSFIPAPLEKKEVIR